MGQKKITLSSLVPPSEFRKKGRDPDYRCMSCGRYIAYDDIPDNVNYHYTPDTDFSIETHEFTHLKCMEG